MKKGQITIGLAALLLLIAVFTNPDLSRHREAVKTKIMNTIGTRTFSADERGQAGAALGMFLGGSLVDMMIDNLVTCDDYIVCSLTKVTFRGTSRIVGIGLFGNVFLSDRFNNAFENL